MKTSCGKLLNLAHYFPYDVKLRLLAHSRSFLANQKARKTIVGAENLLMVISIITQVIIEILALSMAENGVIFRYNHLRRDDYSERTNFQNSRLALYQ